QSVSLLIGPEGGFSADEADQAMAAGFVPVRLGPNRLRTETAALYAFRTYQ
ncbi:MAG: RsmE family RNA methyltransferase, partial [Bacteroidota bacterium]